MWVSVSFSLGHSPTERATWVLCAVTPPHTRGPGLRTQLQTPSAPTPSCLPDEEGAY